MKKETLNKLKKRVQQCNACPHLPLGPNPVFRAHKEAKILIVGQAPGIKVHETNIPWNDASGERLRSWLGLDRDFFYDEKKVAILPAAFCYPGTGEHGDLPPSKECFPLWHKELRAHMPNIKLTVLLGTYAHSAYLGKRKKKTLTESVQNWEEYLPEFIVLPHPSPLNNIWLAKNPWFNNSVVPKLSRLVKKIFKDNSGQ